MLTANAEGTARRPADALAFQLEEGTLLELLPQSLAYPAEMLDPQAFSHWPKILDAFHDHSRINRFQRNRQ